MKNRFLLVAFLLKTAFLLAVSCNSLEVTLPQGPKGEQGIQGVAGKDGLSAYEVWVSCVKDHQINDWDGGTGIEDYFKYLKGKDGADGKSAFELWREYVLTGAEDPKNPGEEWDTGRISERDFYDFLSGSDGKDGNTPFIGENGNWWIIVEGELEVWWCEQ